MIAAVLLVVLFLGTVVITRAQSRADASETRCDEHIDRIRLHVGRSDIPGPADRTAEAVAPAAPASEDR